MSAADAAMDLRERLAAALNEAGHCGHPGGESCAPWWQADAVIPALAAWLRDLAAEQWERGETHGWEPSRQMATVRAMYLTDLAIELAATQAERTGDHG